MAVLVLAAAALLDDARAYRGRFGADKAQSQSMRKGDGREIRSEASDIGSMQQTLTR